MSLGCSRVGLFVCVLIAAHTNALSAAGRDNPEKIEANQMRAAAGSFANGVLTVSLEARDGVWLPDGPDGMARYVAAFSEAGKALQNPGPLIRVTQGTEVRVTMRNRLAQPLWIYGLGEQRGIAADSFMIEPGAVREISFTANEAGLYYYAGKTTPLPVLARGGHDSQLNGAIVVDPAGASTDDRVFLISWWGDADSTRVSGLQDGAVIVVNGLSWPHTQRVRAVQNEELRWKWLSVTAVPHPMHLHGFYFRVDATGDGASFKEFAPEDRQLAVTEFIVPGGTMAMTWKPDRPGNWIFHCHFAGHMTSMEGWNKDRRHPEAAHAKSSHDQHFMAGLVVGIQVEPKGEMKASTAAARPVRLIVRAKPRVYGEYGGYAYVLGGSPEESDTDAMPLPGPTLVLEKNQPVAVTIINQSHEGAAVHWHGIELESFPDGVPGVSGYGKTLLPAIPPRDSLTVRFTPPRAGTFMYHSHFNELQQIGSGLYGAIVVREPDQQFDPRTDKILLVSDGGPIVNVIQGPFPPTLLNGSSAPKPVELQAGTKYRFRLINIRAELPGMVSLKDGERPVQWRMVARDGADLPVSQIKDGPAVLVFAPGQIFDFEFTPQQPGELKFSFGYPPLGDAPLPPPGELSLIVK